ncbi:hypothetical protein LMB51_06585 [Limosilactobacillus reuteri]|nr:hypothetical protein [Limosilactobacillus reuteri]
MQKLKGILIDYEVSVRSVVFIIVSIILFVILWNMINIPILKAFIIFTGAVGIGSAVIGTSN